MNGKTKASYLDLTALPTVGAALLSPRPAWVFSADGTAILWANVAGLRTFGTVSLADLLDRRLGRGNPLVSQIARLCRTLPNATPRLEILKLTTGVTLTTLPAACQRLNLADGGRVVFAMAMTDERTAQSIDARANALSLALAGKDGVAAIVASDGRVIGGSERFTERSPGDWNAHSVAFDADGQVFKLIVADDGAATPAVWEDERAVVNAVDRATKAAKPERPESDTEAAEAADVTELRALVNGPPVKSNVVPLPGAAGQPPPGQEQLSGHERDAFRRIAETLSESYAVPAEGDGAPDEGEKTQVSDDDTHRSESPIKSGMSGDGGERDANVDATETLPPAAPVPDTAILGRLPIAIVVFREDETLYANNALIDLLGYDSADAFFAAGGREVLFADDVPAQSLSLVPDPIGDPGAADRDGGRGPGSQSSKIANTETSVFGSGMSGGHGEGTLTARTRDGAAIAVEARLQSVTWGDAPALMLSLREAEPVGAVRVRGPESPIKPGMSGGAGALPPADAGENDDVSRRTLIEEIAGVQDRLGELEAILDVATDGVIVLDATGRIGNLNRAAEALFGVEAGDVLGRPFTDLLAEESRPAARDYLDGLATNGVASVLNDGREVIGKVPQGGLIPLFMTMGRLGRSAKFCAVLRDITHWKNVEEELIAARRAAETANSLKSEFLAKISHEIRTPLNAIIGFSEVMMGERFGPIGNERYKDYLRDIHISGDHLMSLINDLLDLSKIESGKLELDLQPVAVNGVIQESVALMQPEANRARIIIRTSLADAMPQVVADQRSLRQILLNLLSNAIKFTPEGGQVIVSTTVEETGAVTLKVRDTGVGMSADEVETALMPFRQLATSGRERRDGTGLGLPLTKALVEANHATFAIESQVDQGTLVKVTFPQSAVVVGR